MDNKFFKQLLREGLSNHKKIQLKPVQEASAAVVAPIEKGRGREPGSVRGKWSDDEESSEADEISGGFDLYKNSGCTEEEWKERVMDGADPSDIKCRRSKIIWGLNSKENGDSLISLLNQYMKGVMSNSQKDQLVNIFYDVIGAEDGAAALIRLEEVISGSRTEKKRILDGENLGKIFNVIRKFKMKKSQGQKLLRVLDLWGRMNTVKFQAPSRMDPLWVDDARGTTEPPESDGSPGSESETSRESEEIVHKKKSILSKLEKDHDKVDIFYIKDLLDGEKIPDDEKEGWFGWIKKKVKLGGNQLWMLLPLDNAINIAYAIKDGNFRAILANLLLAAWPLDAIVGENLANAGAEEMREFFNKLKAGDFGAAWEELKKFGDNEGSAVTGIHIMRSFATSAGRQKGKIEGIIKAADLIGTILAGGIAGGAGGAASAGTGTAAGAAAGVATWKTVGSALLKQGLKPILEWIVKEFSKYGYSQKDQAAILKDPKGTALNWEWQKNSLGMETTGTGSPEAMYDALWKAGESKVFGELEKMAQEAGGESSESEELDSEDEETEEVEVGRFARNPLDAPGPEETFLKKEAKEVNEQRYKMLLKRFNI